MLHAMEVLKHADCELFSKLARPEEEYCIYSSVIQNRDIIDLAK